KALLYKMKLLKITKDDKLLTATAPAAELPRIAAPAAHSNGTNGNHQSSGHANGEVGGLTPVFIQVANAKREAERSAILAALRQTNWNRRQASAQLQIDYKALLYKMKVLSITKDHKVVTAAG